MGGGANAKPPDPRRKRHPRVGSTSTLLLPASGRKGETPKWPLPKHARPNGAELEAKIWKRLWRLSQAVAWEQLQLEYVVARYCRLLSVWGATSAFASTDENVAGSAFVTNLLSSLISLEDRLGISALAMRRLGWQIVDEDEQPVDDPQIVDIRQRIVASEYL